MEILTAVLAVFSAIGDWFVTIIPDMLGIFYIADTGLTFLGVLACCGLGMSIIFLLVGTISSFFHWRG